jgi:outer membrane protein insertion porin family
LSLGAAALRNFCLRVLTVRRKPCVLALAALAALSSGVLRAQQLASFYHQSPAPQNTAPGQLAASSTPQELPLEEHRDQEPQKKGPYVESIEFHGNRRIRRDSLLARIFTRQGDPYNPDSLNRDFQALWNTGYFDDVTLSVEDSPNDPNGKIVIFTVQERPAIRQIKYKGNKSVSESDILDRFKEAKVGLSVESQFDVTKIKKAEVAIQQLLAEHGRQYATVHATYQRIPASNAVILTFNINEGPKVVVGQIHCVGNHAFSCSQIIRSMRHSRPYAIPLHFFTIDVAAKTFDKEKLDEDIEIGCRGLYQDAGYFEVLCAPSGPILKPVKVDKKGLVKAPLPLIGSHHKRATDITIEIEEGERYRMGKLYIRNADPTRGLSLKREGLQKLFPLKQGDIFDVGKIRKAMETYTKIYGQFGFIDFTATPEFDIDHKNKVINLTLTFDEEKQYYVHRINISGNVTTRDKVIRRELLIDEGDLYNNRLWEISVLRLNQLQFFEPLKPETAAEVKKNPKNGTVDLNLKVKEKGKQSISLTGGVSGLAGTFVGLTYQTNNFLGLGETLTLSAQVGSIQRNYTFGFTEPYLFDRPISTGFTVFSSYFDYDQAREESILLGQAINLSPLVVQNYAQNSDGFKVFASYPIKHAHFLRVGITYGYTVTSINASSSAASILFENLQFQTVAGPSALNGIHQSYISPSLSYNTLNPNALDPVSGKAISYSANIEGIGGNTRAINNTFDFKYFHPTYHHRNVIGFHFLGGFLTGYGGNVPPPFERYYTGGEDSIRGFDIRIVSPLVFIPVPSSTTVTWTDPRYLTVGGAPQSFTATIPTASYTITFPGGDTLGVFNTEYRIPLVGHYASMDFFLDAGTTGVLRRDQLQLSETSYSTLATDLPDTPFRRDLQFAPHSNFFPRVSTGIEFVVNLPMIHAPFRIYYAYNVVRYDELIVAPQGDFYLSDAFKNSLCCNILQTQILPQLTRSAANPATFNYIDPLKTVRFTVSRTF